MFCLADSPVRGKTKLFSFSEAAFNSPVAGIPKENGQNSELYMQHNCTVSRAQYNLIWLLPRDQEITDENDIFRVMCMLCINQVHSSYDIVEKSLSYIEWAEID